MSGETEVPDGFEPVESGGAYVLVNGPLWLFHRGDVVKLGFRVEERHTNPLDICHGGMVATFCDMLQPMVARRVVAALNTRFLPTVSLQIDYLRPSPRGAWVEGRADVLRVTRSLVFMQGLVTADGDAVARTSGVYRIGPEVMPA